MKVKNNNASKYILINSQLKVLDYLNLEKNDVKLFRKKFNIITNFNINHLLNIFK